MATCRPWDKPSKDADLNRCLGTRWLPDEPPPAASSGYSRSGRWPPNGHRVSTGGGIDDDADQQGRGTARKRGPILHRGRVGQAVVRGHDRCHRLGDRGDFLPCAGGEGWRHVAGRGRRPRGLRQGSVAPHEPRRAGRVPASAGGRSAGTGGGCRADMAPGVRCRARLRRSARGRLGERIRLLRRAGRHLPVRGAGDPVDGRVWIDRAGTRRRGRGNHPLERSAGDDHLQGRPRPARRVHGRAQMLPRGAR